MIKIKTIVLIGFMASGKTTVGRLLASSLELPFIDLDKVIVERTGQSISQLFEHQGEAYFRNLEYDYLSEYIQQDNCVIATGGGVIENNNCQKLLEAHYPVIFLTNDMSILLQRLTPEEVNKRPVLKQKDFKQTCELYQKRYPYYLISSDILIDTTKHSPESVVQIICESL